MAYSPPGVQTFIEIGDNQVILPGGTRILSLIGTSNPTVSIAGEQWTQTIARQIQTTESGVASVARVYDYSGPGNSLYVYPASGSGAYGSGYFVSGNNTIAWTPAANTYPSSTTPASGAAFLVNYNFSGTTLSGTTVLEGSSFTSTYTGFSGSKADALNISGVTTNIIAVYSGASSASGIYPFSGTVGVSGAGWYATNGSLFFTNGIFTDFTAAAAKGFVPASGATYYIDYVFSGTATLGNPAVASLTQNGAYNVAIGQPFPSGIVYPFGINAISGTSGYTYPASGTGIASGTSATDSSGYSTVGTGWNFINSGTSTAAITWGATNPTTYAYPKATVVPISGVFAIDYNYNKYGTDYTPQNFVEYSAVINQEGNEGDWVLQTTGPLAGTYKNIRVNPLTVGAKVAFANSASVVNLLQISGVANTSASFLNVLPYLESNQVDVIVPLTIGSGISVGEMPFSEKALTLQYVKLHCDTMSNEFNKMERVSLGSMGPAEVGIGDGPNSGTYSYISVAQQLADKRIALVAPGTTTVQLQDPSGQFQNVDVDGCFLAVAVGALSCSANNDPATPLTNQQLTGFTRISAKTAAHPNTAYLTVEKNNMAAAGVMIIDSTGSKIFVRHQLTTDQTNVINGEFSVVTLIDYVSQSVRYTTDQFIGKKLIPALVIPSVKGTILATMAQLAANGIIGAVGTINVTIDPNDPTNLLSQVSYVPVFPLNRLKVTFIIRTSI